MAIEWTIFLGEQLLAILIFSLMALIAVWNRQKAFLGQSALQQTENYPLERFQQFMASRAKVMRSYRQTQSIGLIVMAVIIVLSIAIGTSSSTGFSGANSVTGLLNPILALFIGLLVGSYINDVVGAIVVDGEAMRFFQIGTLQRSDVQKQKLRTLWILYLPILLIPEIVAIGIFMNVDLYIIIACLAFIVTILLVLRIFFVLQLFAFIKPLSPMRLSEWAPLERRIRMWANLMGVELADIYVQKDLIGQINAYLVGLGKPNLLISETFLRYSDWRQQDAIICMVLGLARRNVLQARLLLNLIPLLAILVILLPLLIIMLQPTIINSDVLIGILLPLIVLLLLFFLILFRYTYAGRFIKKRYLDADRLAAFATGDPVALMVAINTINVFNGILPTQRVLNLPSIEEHMRYLDTLVRQSWPRAPQAGTPVASIITVIFGEHYLTVPLMQATEIGPVPAAPFVPLQ